MNSPWFAQNRWHIGSIIIQKLTYVVYFRDGARVCVGREMA